MPTDDNEDQLSEDASGAEKEGVPAWIKKNNKNSRIKLCDTLYRLNPVILASLIPGKTH